MPAGPRDGPIAGRETDLVDRICGHPYARASEVVASRGMSDPFLRSSGDEAPPAIRSLGRSFHGMLREAGVPQAHVDEFEALRERWADLVADLDQALESVGFRRHDPMGPGGGFWICWHLREDGVLASWAVTNDSAVEFGDRISGIMHPALQAVLTACGFVAELVPEDEDNAGTVLVTGREGDRRSLIERVCPTPDGLAPHEEANSPQGGKEGWRRWPGRAAL